MKNILILYNPPFREGVFPAHFIKELKEFQFFIFVPREDVEQYVYLKKIETIKKIVGVQYEIDSLIMACDQIINEYKFIDDIVYLDENCVKMCGLMRKYYHMSSQNLDRFCDKWTMYEQLINTDINVPKSVKFELEQFKNNSSLYLSKIERDLGEYPYFIKPIDSSGSRGVSRISNKGELIKWGKYYNSGNYIIQQYLDGNLFHCESFVKNGKILSSYVFEYSRPGFFFTKKQSVGSIALALNDPIRKRIVNFTKDILENLGLVNDGVTHVEVYLTKNDELVFLEAAARPPGLVGNFLYRKYLNISINEIHLLLQLKACKVDLENIEVKNYSARIIFPFTNSGRIKKIHEKPSLSSSFFENFSFNIGDNVEKSENFFNIAGTMVLWNRDYLKLREDFYTLSEYNPYLVQ